MDRKTGKGYPCQITKRRGGSELSWLVSDVDVGGTQELHLTPRPHSARPKVELSSLTGGHRVNVSIFGRLFTSYHHGGEWARPFLHPLIGPGRAPLTRAWPIEKDTKGAHRDHPHHKSLWVAHGECGKVDNWSEEPGHGVQRHQRFTALSSGPVFGHLSALNHWCYASGRKQFEETREMRFYAVPGDVRLFDVNLTFKMSEGPVLFQDTKEGGLLSVRVASSMDVRNGGRIENAFGGVNEAETWGKPSPWCDYSGKSKGKHVGIAVFDHESNPRYPTGWHVRDYGLMTANCFASKHYYPKAKRRGDMAFKKGQKTTWRYRVCIHKGNACQGKVPERYLDYFAPPKVTVK